jgi:hypothetical protein
MAPESYAKHRAQSWTFSLKGLMFVTFVVAVSSALVGISVVLAVVLLPLIAMALVRTARVSRRYATVEAQDGRHPGLTATFFQSLALVICLLMVSCAAFFAGWIAAALIVLGAAGQLCRRAVPVLRRFTTRLWLIAARGWRETERVRVKFGPLFCWIRARAIDGAMLLASASRLLFQRCWHPA